MDDLNSQLSHFGIKGMKWGTRRASTLKTQVKSSTDHKNAERLKTKNIKSLSNSELRDLNNRLQLERQYKELNKTQTNRGKKIVTDILTNSAKQVASVYVTKYMTKGLDKLLTPSSAE